MAKSDSARRSSDSKPSILSRDRDGLEHRLGVVDHPAGLVTLYDEELVRVMHPAGPISGAY